MNTATYWARRYRAGGTSGAGSRGAEAQAKAALIDRVMRADGLSSVLDLGAGDGYVAGLLTAPALYVGYDPAVPRAGGPEGRFDLVLSFDVLHHLPDDAEYRVYLGALFGRSDRVLVWGTDHDQRGAAHVRHRHWTPMIPAGWQVAATEPTLFPPKRWWLLTRAGA